MRQQTLDLVRQGLRVGEVHQADGAAANLVLIGGANAALGGADRSRLVGILAHGIELAMQRQDQGDILSDAQIVRRDRDTLAAQLVDLGDERLRVEHHAIADHRQLGRPHHAGRQQRELVGVAIDDKRVAGIMAALKANNDVSLL